MPRRNYGYGAGYAASRRPLGPKGRSQMARRLVENRAIARAPRRNTGRPLTLSTGQIVKVDIRPTVHPSSKWYGAPGQLSTGVIGQAKSRSFLKDYLVGMRGRAPGPMSPSGIPSRGPRRNIGSFKSRPGSWKKGAGGRFVGSA